MAGHAHEMRTLLAMLETEEAHELSMHVRDAWTTVCASIGSRTSGKPKGAIQHDSPGRAHESNCVPAPRGHFILRMRLYWLGPEILGDAWTPPAIEHI